MREKSKEEHKKESKEWIDTLATMPWFRNHLTPLYKINILSKDGLIMWFHCFECSFNAIKQRCFK